MTNRKMEVPSKAQQREGRRTQVVVFGSSFLLSNLVFLFVARKQANSVVRMLGAALPIAMVPCGISGWRLGEHMNQSKPQQVVAVCALMGVAFGIGLYKRRIRLANPFENKSLLANYLPLGISFGSAGLGLGYAARRYVDDGFGV